ncbi:dienelactone hydrolase [Mycena vitilis]|nr:dienelactone hydrolase [Mycena vitilis]
MSLCDNCIKGVRHEGTPTGKLETIGGIQSYVATPTGDFPKEKVILFLTDVFGLSLENNKLLADDFAQNGFKTIMPDLFHGDTVPIDAFDKPQKSDIKPAESKPAFNLPKWLLPDRETGYKGHTEEFTRPIIDAVLEALKAEGVKRFAAVGYCFGGRYVFDLAFDNAISVAATSHPSLLQIPTDLEKYAASSKAPLLINSCEEDDMFPIEAQALADKILTGFPPGYKREYFAGCSHGFAVRGDLSDPKVKAGKEGAFKNTVEWFKKYL